MANSIEEAIAEAIVEIKAKDWVIDAVHDTLFSDDLPFNYVRKRIIILHQVRGGDHAYGNKELLINKTDFTYLWHHGGSQIEAIDTPFRDLLESREDGLKSYYGVDWAEIIQCDEITESGIVSCVSSMGATDLAEMWTLKTWKIDDTTVGHKIIEKTTIS